MSISNNNDRLTVIIPKTLKEDLKNLADLENRSVSNYVANLLESHVTESRGTQRPTRKNQNQRTESEEKGVRISINKNTLKEGYEYLGEKPSK